MKCVKERELGQKSPRLWSRGRGLVSRRQEAGGRKRPPVPALWRLLPASRRLSLRGQSTLETAVLIAVVMGALMVMFSYIRDAVSSRVKVGSDSFGHGLLNSGN